MSETVSCGPVVIGAGAIGLAVAQELAKNHKDVVVLESEAGFGHHTSSRNSEVIHSGIYYTPGSLKSELCLKGKKLLYKFLNNHGIQYNMCGKLIVANYTDAEQRSLESLIANALEIGLPHQEVFWNDPVIRQSIPLKSCRAILISETGHFDSHEFMCALERLAVEIGATISYKSRVTTIIPIDNQWELSVNDDEFKIRTNTIINAAGLYADKIAHMAGFTGYKQFFYKGEYYKTNKLRNLKHLVYSVPPADQMSLGIHTRSYSDGSIGFGPNAYPVNDVNYDINDSNNNEFLKDINKYFDINFDESDIYPDYSGIRPKINGGGFKSDFQINKEECDGDRAMISMVGIESPGLTCSMAIAEYVAKLLADQ